MKDIQLGLFDEPKTVQAELILPGAPISVTTDEPVLTPLDQIPDGLPAILVMIYPYVATASMLSVCGYRGFETRAAQAVMHLLDEAPRGKAFLDKAPCAHFSGYTPEARTVQMIDCVTRSVPSLSPTPSLEACGVAAASIEWFLDQFEALQSS